MSKIEIDADFEYWLDQCGIEDEDDREAIIDAIMNEKSVLQYKCFREGSFKILTGQYGGSRPFKIVSAEAEAAIIKIIENYKIYEEDELEKGFRRNMEGKNT